MSSISKANKNCFRVSDVEVAIGFGRESSPDLTSSCCKMGFPQVGMDLRISSGFVKLAKETFLKDGSTGGSRRFSCLLSFCSFGFLCGRDLG